MNTAQLPAAIEIFRPGAVIDDAGVERTFTAADIQAMAEGYDPALREAPLCIGHPESNLPAYGWVQRLAVNDASRLASPPRGRPSRPTAPRARAKMGACPTHRCPFCKSASALTS